MSWLYPINPPAEAAAKPSDAPVRLANSEVKFDAAQLVDLFFAPDWFPGSHGPMPEIVLRGRPPATFACGYCHLPGGEGRPENAPLAGLPAQYIVQQVKDMRAGLRRSAWRGPAFMPSELMLKVAGSVSDADLLAAAQYFSAQVLPSRLNVIESTRIPRMRISAWIYSRDPREGEEALGRRLIEWAPDLKRHEERDASMRYSVSVPRGSLRHGERLALSGAQSCSSCHGLHLQGTGLIPPLAGRSPSYLLRQLLAFQSRDRAGAAAGPMQDRAASLTLDDMIAVVAYAAAL